MGWNGSGGNKINSGSHKLQQSGNKPRSFNLGYGVVILFCIAIVACWFFFSSSSENASEEPSRSRSRQIQKASPSKPTPVEVAEDDEVEEPAPEPWENDPRVVNGIVTYASWGPVKSAVTGGVHRTISLDERCFDKITDQQLATLITHKPGDYLLCSSDEIDYRNFKENFLESLKEPIVCSKDDTPDMVALKKAVREARLEIKDRMDAGEDIVKLMVDARRELAELGAYKEELEREIQRVVDKEETTEEDYEDVVKAANIMLESRGIEKLVMPEVLKEQIRFRREYKELMKENPTEVDQ